MGDCKVPSSLRECLAWDPSKLRWWQGAISPFLPLSGKTVSIQQAKLNNPLADCTFSTITSVILQHFPHTWAQDKSSAVRSLSKISCVGCAWLEKMSGPGEPNRGETCLVCWTRPAEFPWYRLKGASHCEIQQWTDVFSCVKKTFQSESYSENQHFWHAKKLNLFRSLSIEK